MMILKFLNDTKIIAITIASNTAEWFFCRCFSFTSYSADCIINNILHLPKNTRNVLGAEESNIINCKKYLWKNNQIIIEYDEIARAHNFITELNYSTPKGESKREEFKLKLGTMINNVCNKDNLLNICKAIT